jgi:hypothetical protein
MDPVPSSILCRLSWMAGIWTASVMALGIVAYAIRLAIL